MYTVRSNVNGECVMCKKFCSCYEQRIGTDLRNELEINICTSGTVKA